MKENLAERRAYIKKLLDDEKPINTKELARMFDCSEPTIYNDWVVAEFGVSDWPIKSSKMNVASQQNNRARKLGLSGRVTRDEWVAVCEKFGNKCANCHEAEPLTMDHIQPLSKGGQHCIENIQPLCMPCNRQKWDKWDPEVHP